MPEMTVLLKPDAPPSWESLSPDLALSNSPLSSKLPPSDSSSLFIPVIHSSPSDISHSPSPNEPLSLSSQPIPIPVPVPAVPPLPPPLHHSQHPAALNNAQATALLTTYSPLHRSHDLVPLSVSDPSLPLDFVLSALADGSLTPIPDTGDDPLWKDALALSECEYLVAGMCEEIQSLADLQVFDLISQSSVPPGQRPMKGKLVCKRKCDNLGNVAHYKVRYVAKGYAQEYSVDYDKTTAPTAHLESFRTILHLAASLDWELQQFDIKTAFLHDVLPSDKIAYMEQPPSFEEPGKEDWVWQLMKSIYGMKQASCIWNKTFHDTVHRWGF